MEIQNELHIPGSKIEITEIAAGPEGAMHRNEKSQQMLYSETSGAPRTRISV